MAAHFPVAGLKLHLALLHLASQSTSRYPFPLHASLISWVTAPVCPRLPGISRFPPFCTEVLTQLFFCRKSVRCQDRTLRKFFPLTLSNETDLNCSWFFGIFFLRSPNCFSKSPSLGNNPRWWVGILEKLEQFLAAFVDLVTHSTWSWSWAGIWLLSLPLIYPSGLAQSFWNWLVGLVDQEGLSSVPVPELPWDTAEWRGEIGLLPPWSIWDAHFTCCQAMPLWNQRG